MLYRLMVAVSVLVVGTASYFGVHYAGTVFAEDPPDEENGKNAIELAVEADLAKPVQNGVVNGISIVPDNGDGVSGASGASGGSGVRSFEGESPCTDDNPPVPGGSNLGELDFANPSSWTSLNEWVVSCGDTAMSLYREMEPDDDPLADILVMRWRRAIGVELKAATDRVSAVTVAGKKAVHVEPVRTESGMAIEPDQLAVTETWGITMVTAWQTSSNSLSAQQVYEQISAASTNTQQRSPESVPTPIP
ncbi:MAG: hypothetical protein OXS35_06330 [Dehalococcoidia bacterium]|nr:hypothetical protein [Dehalococcoidia bacterium]